MDFTKPENYLALIEQAAPQVIINAVAYTAVDKAESERELAFAVNAAAPRLCSAEEAKRFHAGLIHLLDRLCL